MTMQPPTDPAGKPLTKNQHLLQWVDEMARLTKPDTHPCGATARKRRSIV